MSEAPSIELPQYISHKRVWALKIARSEPTYRVGYEDTQEVEQVNGVRLHFADTRYAPMSRGLDYAARIKQGDDPGYWVRYADGFESWSPTEAFEGGYSRVDAGEAS